MATNNELTTRILLRTDTTARWTEFDPVLLKGEVAITLDTDQPAKIKIGDGTSKWSETAYVVDVETLVNTLIVNSTLLGKMEEVAENAVAEGLATVGGAVYQVTSLDEITATPKKGDVAIVSKTISDGKVELTAYVYDTTASDWVAMDGNYDAKNIYFADDLVFTKEVGTVTIPDSGSQTYEAAGKNLYEVLSGIFAQEDSADLRETNPSLAVTTATQYVEIGSTVTPTYETSFEDGKYKYGPEPTGVTVVDGSYSVSNNKTDEKVLAASGSFAEYTFESETTYQVTAHCATTVGNAPRSNIGNEYSAQAFAAIADLPSSAKTLYSSYKPNFYGYRTSTNKLATVSKDTITSDVIRGLQNNQKQTTTPVTSYEIKEKWMQFFYAVPTGRKQTLTAKDGNNVTLGVDKYTDVTLNHEGSATSSYTVFVINNAAEYDPTKITLTWA